MNKKWLLGILAAGSLIGAGFVACGSGSIEAPGDLDEMYVDTFVENINGEVDKAIEACESDPMCASGLPSVAPSSSSKKEETPESSSATTEAPASSAATVNPGPTPIVSSSSAVDIPPGAVVQSSSSVDIPPGAVSPIPSSSSVAVTPTPTPSSSSVAPSSSSVAVKPSSSSVAVTPSSSSVAPSSSSVAAGGGEENLLGETNVAFTSGDCKIVSTSGYTEAYLNFDHGWQSSSCTVTVTVNGTALAAQTPENCGGWQMTRPKVNNGDEVCLTLEGADGNSMNLKVSQY